jgi:hypothetical protein
MGWVHKTHPSEYLIGKLQTTLYIMIQKVTPKVNPDSANSSSYRRHVSLSEGVTGYKGNYSAGYGLRDPQ